jgi:hypothetical protein
MDYIIVVQCKYLQMMMAYAIFKEDSARATSHIEQFNEQFHTFAEIFENVTNSVYKCGRKIVLEKPTAKVIPSLKESAQCSSIDQDDTLHAFLAKFNLMDLEDNFRRKNITLEDVLEMDKEEMEEVGIKAYKQRKLLWRAIQGHLAGGIKYSIKINNTYMYIFL